MAFVSRAEVIRMMDERLLDIGEKVGILMKTQADHTAEVKAIAEVANANALYPKRESDQRE